MAEFLLHHTHRSEDCGRIFDSLRDADPSVRGRDFLCTCPSGNHGGFFQVEAADAGAALNMLSDVMRGTTTVYPVEKMAVP